MTGKSDTRLERLFFFGRPLSPLYSYIMAKRSLLYQRGGLKQSRLEVPVISVGNLVLGGTGKTPLVQHIAKLLQRNNRKPAILSRGYKGSATAAVNVVSDTRATLLNAAEAGDEPRLLAEKLPGIPVITGKKRFVTGRFAIDSFKADTLILDDGFQHMALARNLDLVLFNARQRLGNGRVLPGGELREPLTALKRADAFIITDMAFPPQDREAKDFIDLLAALHPEKPIFTSSYQPEKMLTMMHQGKNEAIPQLEAGRIPLFGFCGIAGPESFRKTLETSGMRLTGFREFADHHTYSNDDLRSLIGHAQKTGAKGLVTTEKDLVKLRDTFPREFLLLVQPVKLQIGEDFDRFVLSHLEKKD